MSSAYMLAALVASGAGRDRRIVLTRVRRGEMLASFGSVLDPRHAQSVIFQPQLDAGLEWCERTLIARGATIPAAKPIHNLAEHRWCSGVAPTDLVYLQAYMPCRAKRSRPAPRAATGRASASRGWTTSCGGSAAGTSASP